jgi:transcriptional regulator with XRE-family HTH domain
MPRKQVSPRSANAIDFVIAARLRARREELNVSQIGLATMVGVTFQQIQKYENGANRVAASRLFAIARALDAPFSYFFEPLKNAAQTKAKKRAQTAGRPD